MNKNQFLGIHLSPVKSVFYGLLVITVASCNTTEQVSEKDSNQDVQVIGAMKNVMWGGQLHGTIDLDTIPNKRNLYGLGPVEFLKGELLIIDGKSYRSTVLTDSTMAVEEVYTTKAPFFVYGNVDNWQEEVLPDDIRTLDQLEEYLEQKSKGQKRPFAFKLEGLAERAEIHIQNLPEGRKVNSPDAAHEGQTNYALANREVEIVGFFSTEHKGVFTHHDTFMHMHLITKDRKEMGHLDGVAFAPGKVKLLLPKG